MAGKKNPETPEDGRTASPKRKLLGELGQGFSDYAHTLGTGFYEESARQAEVLEKRAGQKDNTHRIVEFAEKAASTLLQARLAQKNPYLNQLGADLEAQTSALHDDYFNHRMQAVKERLQSSEYIKLLSQVRTVFETIGKNDQLKKAFQKRIDQQTDYSETTPTLNPVHRQFSSAERKLPMHGGSYRAGMHSKPNDVDAVNRLLSKALSAEEKGAAHPIFTEDSSGVDHSKALKSVRRLEKELTAGKAY